MIAMLDLRNQESRREGEKTRVDGRLCAISKFVARGRGPGGKNNFLAMCESWRLSTTGELRFSTPHQNRTTLQLSGVSPGLQRSYFF